MKYLMYLTFFTFMTLVFILLLIVFFADRSRTKTRMNQIRESSDSITGYATSDKDRKEDKERKVKFKKPSFMGRYLTKKATKLTQAYILMKPEEFLLISIGLFVLGFIIMYLLTNLFPIGILGGVIGFILPDTYIGSIKRKRGIKLNNQLPEALDVISNGLRAGLSFSQAVSIAGKDLESPISDEFTKIIRDNTLGKTMEDSLLDFTKRTDDEDVDMFVTAMIIQRQVGGNLAEILDTISNTIRERVRIKGEVRTLTAQSKLSAIIISLLPIMIALALSVINPRYIGVLFTNILGLVMVGMAVIMMIIGIYIMMRLVKLDV